MADVASNFQWLLATLGGDSALTSDAPGGVHVGPAPVGTLTPYVQITHQGGRDVLTANAIRLMSSELYQVVAYGLSSDYAALVTVAARIDALLGRTSAPAGGIAILACYREQQLALDELVGAIPWSRLGGLYRIES